jgi:hypothetical protein
MADGGVGPGRAGFAGAGIGTVLVGIGKGLPSGFWKDVLLYGAPTISVVVGVVVLYVQMVVMTSVRWRLFHNLEARTQSALNDPNTSEEHKKHLQKEIEDARQALVRQEARQLRLLGRPRR